MEYSPGLLILLMLVAFGSAIIGAQKGDTVAYTAPNGKELQVVIVDAVPFTG